MKRQGLTLFEERFCVLVAQGQSAVDAYCEAFGALAADETARRRITKKASALTTRRPDIAARIAEAKGEEKRREREKWQRRGDEIAEGLYNAITEAIRTRNAKGRPNILTGETLKGVEVLARMKGLNAPEETVLKDGGVADGYRPRALESLSDADLDAIIADAEGAKARRGDVIEAEAPEGRIE